MSARKELTTALVWIAGILIVIGGAGYGAYRYWYASVEDSQQIRIHLRELAHALDLYFQDCKDFPTAEQGLEALTKAPAAAPLCAEWGGPYFDEGGLSDPWGRAFVYTREGAYYSLQTLGSDGEVGGEELAADLNLEDL